MEELEKIIRNNQMNFWNQKKFSNMFICDGESKSYSFCFEKASISFSSQVYPTIYRTKLKKFDEVIDNYLEGAKEKKGLFGKKGKIK